MIQKVNLIRDIYYTDRYISLFLKEDDKLFDFIYKEGEQILINKSIKRPIKNIGSIEVNEGFYDLESAYGYGGFYTNTEDVGFVSRAMDGYIQRCNDENIISEFVRFHPFNNFPKLFDQFLDLNIYDRDVVFVDLSNDIWTGYKAKVRNTIKRATEKVEWQKSVDIESFYELYCQTMKKNNADDFYFFDKNMFVNLLKNEKVELHANSFNEEIVVMAFFMFGSKIGHYHLSANSPLSYKINANYSLLNTAFKIAQERGMKYFLLGGGTSSSEDDPLLKFKKKFSETTLPFFISGKIYNKSKFNEYNELWKQQSSNDIKYFQKYRLSTDHEG